MRICVFLRILVFRTKFFHKIIDPSTPPPSQKRLKTEMKRKQKLVAETITCEDRMFKKHFRVISFLLNDSFLGKIKQKPLIKAIRDFFFKFLFYFMIDKSWKNYFFFLNLFSLSSLPQVIENSEFLTRVYIIAFGHLADYHRRGNLC